MKPTALNRTLAAGTVAALMALSYTAGAATPPNTEAIAKLDQSVPFLVKADAILGASGTNRQGYPNVAKARADIADAMKEIDKAIKANGG